MQPEWVARTGANLASMVIYTMRRHSSTLNLLHWKAPRAFKQQAPSSSALPSLADASLKSSTNVRLLHRALVVIVSYVLSLAGFPFMVMAAFAPFVFGCTEHDPGPGASNAPSSDATNPDPVTDKWLGQWDGPEGTFLRLEGGIGRYELTIQDLDGPRTFQGSTVGDLINFDRDGATESIRATNGVGTGMKWLSEKSDCLTIRLGEGYCRD